MRRLQPVAFDWCRPPQGWRMRRLTPPPELRSLPCAAAPQAHRLKNKDTKTAVALANLKTRRRILLSGAAR